MENIICAWVEGDLSYSSLSINSYPYIYVLVSFVDNENSQIIVAYNIYFLFIVHFDVFFVFISGQLGPA
jgi:hypothetical protein